MLIVISSITFPSLLLVLLQILIIYKIRDQIYIPSQKRKQKNNHNQNHHFIKRILLVDDDPDITLTFKAGLDSHYYGDGDKRRRFEVCTYNDPLLVLKEFKPDFYDLLLTDIYMPNMNGFQLCEKILK